MSHNPIAPSLDKLLKTVDEKLDDVIHISYDEMKMYLLIGEQEKKNFASVYQWLDLQGSGTRYEKSEKEALEERIGILK